MRFQENPHSKALRAGEVFPAGLPDATMRVTADRLDEAEAL
jgi:hypothetical protein